MLEYSISALHERKPDCCTPVIDSDAAKTPSVCALESQMDQKRKKPGNSRKRRQLDMYLSGIIDSLNSLDLSASTSTSGMEPERPSSAIKQQRPPNYWEQIIKRHAKDLQNLPVPPKNFVKLEKEAPKRRKTIRPYSTSRSSKGNGTSLKHLLRGNEQQQALVKPKNTCYRWVLQPMTDKGPEPRPGVPTIIVTTPEGETRWPKDMNSYISKEKVAWITERATKEHHGAMSDVHCALFQELHEKGMSHEPYGHRPEVLYCTQCLAKQLQIEDEEYRLVSEGAHVDEEGDGEVA